MARKFEMDLDYIDVAARIVEFRDKHPEGALRQVDVKFIDFAGVSWIVYTAAAHRSPDDTIPGMGTAWEPVPGKTPYTKDSELQNAETAAWGRAIVAALAADTKKGIASAEEVRNRQAEREPTSDAASLIYQIGKKAQEKGLLVGVREAWKAEHDGQDITEASDVDGLRKVLANLDSVSRGMVDRATGREPTPADLDQMAKGEPSEDDVRRAEQTVADTLGGQKVEQS